MSLLMLGIFYRYSRNFSLNIIDLIISNTISCELQFKILPMDWLSHVLHQHL